MDIIKRIKNIVEKDFEIVDITFNRESTGRVLRILVDGDKLGLDRLGDISRKISSYLDEHENEIPYSNYTLEVSSVGLDRPLKKREDFIKNIGQLCKISTKDKEADGRRRYTGVIKKVTDDSVEIYSSKEGQSFVININNISKANIEFEF